MKEYHLNVPLQEKEVRQLRAGDIVRISGRAFIAGMVCHRRIVDQGMMPRVDLNKCNFLWHTGQVLIKQGDKWKLVAAGGTTSLRYERWMPAMIEKLGLRAIMGKGAMGENTRAALQKFGCVHLGKIGMITGVYNAQAVKEVIDVDWLELGEAEALWTLRVENLGPFVVDMDSTGGLLYDKIYEKIETEKIPAAYHMLGLGSPSASK